MTLGALNVRNSRVVEYVKEPYVKLLMKDLPDIHFEINATVRRTTTQTLTIIDSLLNSFKPCVTVIILGGNDADIDWRRFAVSKGKIVIHSILVEQYTSNLKQLIRKIRNADSVAVLTDTPGQNVDMRGLYLSQILKRNISMLIDNSGGQQTSDDIHNHYDKAIRSVAEKTKTDLALYGEVLASYPPQKVFGPDGVHPNEMGHRLIAQTLLPVIARACGRAYP